MPHCVLVELGYNHDFLKNSGIGITRKYDRIRIKVDSLSFKGFPKSWDDFIFFGEIISEIISEPLDKAGIKPCPEYLSLYMYMQIHLLGSDLT